MIRNLRRSALQSEKGVLPVSEKEFSLFQELIYRNAGIFLGPAKKAFLAGRLSRRLRDLNIRSLREYYRRVVDAGEDELVTLLDNICTHETHFFREPRHFEFLEKQVFPEWKSQALSGLRKREIRVWSAACSTGEEPYSLAMVLFDQFSSASGWDIKILATDLSTRVLKNAEAGVFSKDKAHEIPEKYLKSYMLKGTGKQSEKIKAGTLIRSIIQFKRLNLYDSNYPLSGYFDLIFCRNVFIYFNNESKSHVIRLLLNYLVPNGYLFLGHAENINFQAGLIRSIIPAVYSHASKIGQTPAGPIHPFFHKSQE
ncbi:MAG: CheR family methyltransferase [Nitrospiria bacterium]